MSRGDLYADIPAHLPAELFEQILGAGSVRIERIVSRGHTSPGSGWYDQDSNEWVLVLRGAGRIQFEDGAEVTLEPGQYLDIKAHRRHRVSWTDPENATVWLAVFYN